MVIAGYATHPAADLLPMLPDKEVQELADSIGKGGLLQPITLLEGLILDGRNRLKACELAGVKPVFEDWTGEGSPVEWVLSMNLKRRHLNASQKAMIAAEALPLLEEEARVRQQEAARATNARKSLASQSSTLEEKIPQASERAPQARQIAAMHLGVNERYVQDAKSVLAGSPELARDVRDGKTGLAHAKKQLKRRGIVESARVDAAAREPGLYRDIAAAPACAYRCIYIDPPWPYDDANCDGSAEREYPTMGLDAIKALDVARLAHPEGSHIWMWATWPKLRERAPHDVLDAWGFRWVGEVVWNKQRPSLGRWLHSITEVLILGVRGVMPLMEDGARGYLAAERRGHSEKPNEARGFVERLSPGPRVEVFARKCPEGWDGIGNEVTRG